MTPAAFDFEIFPGNCLGPFALGASLWSTLEYVRQQQTAFPQITVSFDNSAPSNSPVLLHIRPYIDLLFSPTQQRLHTISIGHIGNDPPLTLRYNSQILLSSDTPFRRSDVSKIFGPTYAGPVMRYPGLSFSFDEDGSSSHSKKMSTEDRYQPVRRLTLIQYPDSSHAPSPMNDLDSVVVCAALEGELEKVIFTVKEGAALHFFSIPSNQQRTVRLRLGQTCSQDALVELGPPLRIHNKDDDRMAIHARQTNSPVELKGYFYNYFQHGLDLFFAETSHELLKIIAHSNLPGSPLFQRYQRCPWEIEAESLSAVKSFSTAITLRNKINELLEPASIPFRMQVDRSGDPSISLTDTITQLTGLDGIVFESSEMGDILSFTVF